MKRRILSSLMALVLVFGLLPATAFAEEDAAPAAAKRSMLMQQPAMTRRKASVRQQRRRIGALARR